MVHPQVCILPLCYQCYQQAILNKALFPSSLQPCLWASRDHCSAHCQVQPLQAPSCSPPAGTADHRSPSQAGRWRRRGSPEPGTNTSFLPFPEGTLSRSWPGCLGRTGAVCCMPSLCPTTPSRTRVSPGPESCPHRNADPPPQPSPEPNPGLNRGSPT